VLGFFADGDSAPAPGGGMPIWVLFIGMAFIWIFLVMIPGQKDRKKRDKMQEGLKRGDQVLMQSGIIGRVAQNQGETVTIEVEGAKIKMLRNTVVKIIDTKEGATETKA